MRSGCPEHHSPTNADQMMRQRLAADPLLARYEPVLKRRIAALAKLRGELLEQKAVLDQAAVLK
jgi:hypothetical protein